MAPMTSPKKAEEKNLSKLNIKGGWNFSKVEFFSEYISSHCFDIESISPPTKAAQLETPAKSPKKKNAGKNELELTLIKPAKPLFLIRKKPMMINKAVPAITKKSPFFCSVIFAGSSKNRYPSFLKILFNLLTPGLCP